jgi:hypothetical protein
MQNKKGWFNPALMPYAATFHNLSKDSQDTVVQVGHENGFEEACHTLRTLRSIEYCRKIVSEAT